MSVVATISIAVAAGVVAAVLGWILRGRLGEDKISRAEGHAEALLHEAKEEAEQLRREQLLHAEEEIFKRRQEIEDEIKSKQSNLRKAERALAARETNLDRKVDILTKKEKQLDLLDQQIRAKEKQLQKKQDELEQILQEQNTRLASISGMTSEEAKHVQLQNMIEAAQQEAAASIREIKEKATEEAAMQARDIIVQAIQRTAIDHVVETTVSVVQLPNDDMKGRIIGREGRNIRTFESATGVEVLIDDTPDVVMLSAFDPIRREVARLALEKLIYDGRIHPGRIEEVIEKTRQEIEENIFEYGEQALVDAGLHSVHHELIKLLGRLHFQTCKGQNVLQHCIEVARIAGLMASELELDAKVARRAGLLHEIGYAVTNTSPGTASELSAELAKKYGESDEVTNAIRFANEYDVGNNAISPITVLVSTANEISRSRPGAQKEMLQEYFNRMTSLEEIANSFIGVTNSTAIQAGREIRVIVGHSNVDDSVTEQLAAMIAQKIKTTLTYPGQVKVSVIREYRTIGFAK